MGELLEATERDKGGRPKKTGNVASPVSEPSLKEIGVSKRASAEAQLLASVPRAKFEEVKAGKVKLKKRKRDSSMLAWQTRPHGVLWPGAFRRWGVSRGSPLSEKLKRFGKTRFSDADGGRSWQAGVSKLVQAFVGKHWRHGPMNCKWSPALSLGKLPQKPMKIILFASCLLVLTVACKQPIQQTRTADTNGRFLIYSGEVTIAAQTGKPMELNPQATLKCMLKIDSQTGKTWILTQGNGPGYWGTIADTYQTPN